MQILIEEKHIPVNNPNLMPDINPPVRTSLYASTASAIQVINSNKKVINIIPPTPFLESGLLISIPVLLIQVFANNAFEYHKPPNIKYAIAATATANQLIWEKKVVSITNRFGYVRKGKDYF